MAHFTLTFLLLYDVFSAGIFTVIQPLSNDVELRPLSLEGDGISFLILCRFDLNILLV